MILNRYRGSIWPGQIEMSSRSTGAQQRLSFSDFSDKTASAMLVSSNSELLRSASVRGPIE
jgi:hypothetical protein